MPAPTASIQTLSSAPDRFNQAHWIIGFTQDFWLIHAGGGLLVLPVVLIAYLYPQGWIPLFIAYSLILGLPHICATLLRLGIDPDCRLNHRWLLWLAPLMLLISMTVLVSIKHAAPYMVLVWFLGQTWHINRQNFGILRRYIRMSGSDPRLIVNRTAQAVVQLIPWTAVAICLMSPAKTYLGYPIALPTASLVKTVAPIFCLASLFTLLAYVLLELAEVIRGRMVPGRIMTCLSGALVNLLAWAVVREISWAYLTVSTWHALQYLAYTHAFRLRPPPACAPIYLPLKRHAGFLFLGGLTIFCFFQGLEHLLPSFVIAFLLAMNFHHYLCDTLIWKNQTTRSR